MTIIEGVTVNGEPLVIDEPDEPTCGCRRCAIHDYPGGCLVLEAAS